MRYNNAALLLSIAMMPTNAALATKNHFTTTRATTDKWKVTEFVTEGGQTTMKVRHPVYGDYGYGNAFSVPFKDNDGFFLADFHFNLPTTSATLIIRSCYADDRAVVLLNGTVIDDCSTNGPGKGMMQLTDPGSSQPYIFKRKGYLKNFGKHYLAVTTGFVVGKNDLQLIVNNTGNGIFGKILAPPKGGPESFAIRGHISY